MSKLEEREIIDSIAYRDSGHIEVRKAFLILRDGVEVSRTYHRHVVEPGQDTAEEAPTVQAIAKAMSTHRVAAAKRQKKQLDMP